MPPKMSRPYTLRVDTRGREVIELSESPPPTEASQSFQLRPYQRQGLDNVLEALRVGKTRIGLSSPTGSGKTAMIAALIPEIPSITGRYWKAGGGSKVLVIVPTRELVEQVVDAIKGYSKIFVHVGKEQGSTKSSRHDSIIVATWQTLMQPGRLKNFDPRQFKAIISDEAHGDAADRLLAILHWANEEVQLPKGTKLLAAQQNHGIRVPIIGLSATFARTDKRKLGWVFQEVVYHQSLEDMQAGDFLCPGELIHLWSEFKKLAPVARLRGEVPTTEDEPVVSKELEMFTGEITNPDDIDDFNDLRPTKSMLRVAKLSRFYDYIVEAYREYASDRKATLVFCANVKSVDVVVARFKAKGIKAEGISSKTPETERDKVFKRFKDGKLEDSKLENGKLENGKPEDGKLEDGEEEGGIQVLVNCFIMTEGIDIPKIDAIIIAKPVKSKTLWTQMIGRGLRPSPMTGKVNCKVITLFDNYQKISLGLKPDPELWRAE